MIIYGIILNEQRYFLIIGIINILFFPVYQEIIYNICAIAFFNKDKYSNEYINIKCKESNGIVYSDRYNISFCGL